MKKVIQDHHCNFATHFDDTLQYPFLRVSDPYQPTKENVSTDSTKHFHESIVNNKTLKVMNYVQKAVVFWQTEETIKVLSASWYCCICPPCCAIWLILLTTCTMCYTLLLSNYCFKTYCSLKLREWLIFVCPLLVKRCIIHRSSLRYQQNHSRIVFLNVVSVVWCGRNVKKVNSHRLAVWTVTFTTIQSCWLLPFAFELNSHIKILTFEANMWF